MIHLIDRQTCSKSTHISGRSSEENFKAERKSFRKEATNGCDGISSSNMHGFVFGPGSMQAGNVTWHTGIMVMTWLICSGLDNRLHSPPLPATFPWWWPRHTVSLLHSPHRSCSSQPWLPRRNQQGRPPESASSRDPGTAGSTCSN